MTPLKVAAFLMLIVAAHCRTPGELYIEGNTGLYITLSMLRKVVVSSSWMPATLKSTKRP